MARLEVDLKGKPGEARVPLVKLKRAINLAWVLPFGGVMVEGGKHGEPFFGSLYNLERIQAPSFQQ